MQGSPVPWGYGFGIVLFLGAFGKNPSELDLYSRSSPKVNFPHQFGG